MKKISVISAVAPGRNPGMTSVDLAFRGSWERSGLEAEVSYWQLYHWGEKPTDQAGSNSVPTPSTDSPHDVAYKCFRNKLDAIYDSDAIIFWGDFFHEYQYQKAVCQILIDHEIAQDHDQAKSLVDRHFFLTDAPDEVLRKVLVYGGTFITNHPSTYSDPSYNQNLSRFMSGARRIWMREIYSAMKVAHLRNDYAHAHMGTDCSFLLREQDVDRLPRSEWSEDDTNASEKIGVYFGRSSCNPKLLGKLARELSKKLKLPLEWLPWGDVTAFEDYRKPIQQICPNLVIREAPGVPSMGDLLAIVKQYRFVVTDTYHVCLNAWRMGIPAVCVGEAIPKTAININSGKAFAWRDKRQVFYSMYDAMPFYTYAEELSDRWWRPRRSWHLLQIVKDQALIDSIVARIHHHRDAAEKLLTQECRNMIAQPQQAMLQSAIAS